MCKENLNGKEPLQAKEFTYSPSVFQNLIFERDVSEWGYITTGINILLFHSIRSMGNDNALYDDHTLDALESLLRFKMEIDLSIINTLSVIPKQ